MRERLGAVVQRSSDRAVPRSRVRMHDLDSLGRSGLMEPGDWLVRPALHRRRRLTATPCNGEAHQRDTRDRSSNRQPPVGRSCPEADDLVELLIQKRSGKRDPRDRVPGVVWARVCVGLLHCPALRLVVAGGSYRETRSSPRRCRERSSSGTSRRMRSKSGPWRSARSLIGVRATTVAVRSPAGQEKRDLAEGAARAEGHGCRAAGT